MKVSDDTLIHGLRQKIEGLDAQIADLSEFRTSLFNSIRYLESQDTPQPSKSESVEPSADGDRNQPAKPLTVIEERGNVIEAVLRKEGEPMKKDAIVSGVEELGLYVGQNVKGKLSQVLTKDSRFRNIEPGSGKWGLWEWYQDGETAHKPYAVV